MNETLWCLTFIVPGDDHSSRRAFDAIAAILREGTDVRSCFRIRNRTDGRWFLVLVGCTPLSDDDRTRIWSILEHAQASPVALPESVLVPLLQRFLARQHQARRSGEGW